MPLHLRTRPSAEELFRRYLRHTTRLSARLLEPYNVRGTFERAVKKRDPALAPHGFFRQLAPGNNFHALEFLQKFGPLKLSTEQRLGHIRYLKVDLGEFWGLHLRFRLVAQLWESRNDRERLVQAWQEFFRHHEEASRWEVIPLGSTEEASQWIRFSEEALPIGSEEKYDHLPFPWELTKQPFDEWVRRANLAALREAALGLVHSELIVHTRDRHVGWLRGWEPTREKFRLVVHVDSLWSLIWEFLGWDTAGTPWQRCPHCQRVFYPRRRDQLYCTPRQQALASKRAYAARCRAEERRKKKRRKVGKRQIPERGKQ